MLGSACAFALQRNGKETGAAAAARPCWDCKVWAGKTLMFPCWLCQWDQTLGTTNAHPSRSSPWGAPTSFAGGRKREKAMGMGTGKGLHLVGFP